mmetsp:Transcript_12553/g.20467  ORF Transcript_12553/g.20467 Transcript_12553/m.20467 type:complete len:153 (+) Transcript_12553:226-684(+)|eukprot:CAMPEP_0184675700 /NCGR_PEP_ID=MMETSP0308-20130426/87928_1 /TAXON_ID=38269 /ORGANISM="Gloeochaete witrockiana, Strain SAG 46.84" /LENGTH=152 /DNA_ID=CAMNT_0027123435 /DNA_START=189 /DNA_END=647 /DNA_ORIENTATION=+
MKRFIVALDGSAGAEKALETVLALMDKKHDLLVLASVTTIANRLRGINEDEPMPYVDMLEVKAIQKARLVTLAMLEKYTKICKQREVSNMEVVEALGDARHELCEIVKRVNPDVFAVGSRGMGDLKRLLVGSVSDHLVHNCHCPVLVVRQSL